MIISLRTYLILLAALVVERMFELGLARRNARWAMRNGAIEAGQAHYRAMVAMHAAFIVACAVEAIWLPRHFPTIIAGIALGAELAAQALRYWAIATLGPRWNTRIVVMPGAKPVTGGPYRFLRHPNYLAVAIEIAAVPMIGGAIVTAIVFSIGNGILMAIRIPAEERVLGAGGARAGGA